MRVTEIKSFGLAVIVLALAGCGSAAPPKEPITEWNGSPLTLEQLPYAADGAVTLVELHDAYAGAAECIAEQGVEAVVEEAQSGGFTLWVQGGPGDSREAATAALAGCIDQFVGPLDGIYHATNAPSIEERDEQFTEWKACMEAVGASTDGVVLGDSQSDTIARLEELNGLIDDWPIGMWDCNETYYFVLWPETAGHS